MSDVGGFRRPGRDSAGARSNEEEGSRRGLCLPRGAVSEQLLEYLYLLLRQVTLGID